MRLWGRTSGPRAPELERLAAEAESYILALPQEEKQRALRAVETMAAAGAELRSLPDRLFDVLGRMVAKVVLESVKPKLSRPLSARAMVLQAVTGAPSLLGPHRERIERLIGADGE